MRRAYPLVWLVFVWVLLWGSWSWGDLVNGLLVALLVTTVLPLPAVPPSGRVHAGGALRFLAVLAADLVRSSLQVAWRAVRPGPAPRSSVVAVALRTRSDLVMTVVVESVNLVPGSIVVALDSGSGVLHAHVLGADTDGAVEAFRASVLRLEGRVQAALGEGAGETA